MKRLLPLLLASLLLSGCAAPAAPASATSAPKPERVIVAPTAEPRTTPAPEEERVILGDERFEDYLPLLEGKRAALLTNQSGIVGDVCDLSERERELLLAGDLPFGQHESGEAIRTGEHILDALLARGVEVAGVFSPEHGFRGTEDDGAAVGDGVDAATGVPVWSLYGGSPAAERLGSFDVLIVDLQDVGVRFYTYYLSMFELMELCAAADKEVLVLDRPNPNGHTVDGPVLREGFHSGVGRLPLPVLHGMTLGELARMIDGEGWLSGGANCLRLTVIPCLHYRHSTPYSPILCPSPNLRDLRGVTLYASTCCFENTLLSVGRGTDWPFELYGGPLLEGAEGFGFSFTPRSLPGAQYPPYEGQPCYGRDLRAEPLEALRAQGLRLDDLIAAYEAVSSRASGLSFFGTPDAAGRYWVDLLYGTDELRLMVEAGRSAGEIKASWQDELTAFRALRAPYLLYDE